MPKTLIYDGDCPMCGWIAHRFGELGLAEDGHRRPYQSFDGELADAILEAGIHNEMLVLEPETGELRSGIEGFLWLLADSRWHWLGGLLGLAPVRGLMRLVYRTIAYNRRILAPPPRGIVCACDPDPHPGFRALLLALLGLFDLFGLWLATLAIGWTLLVPTGWTLAALSAFGIAIGLMAMRAGPSQEPTVLIGNVLVVLAGGVLVSAPWLVASLLTIGMLAHALLGVGIGLGVWRCLRSARRRFSRPAVPAAAGWKPNG